MQIEEWLREHIGSSGARVVFTDLQAGSATMAARKALRDLTTVVLVVGANLPMLLDFVLNNTEDPVEAARCYRRALDIDPDHKHAKMQLASLRRAKPGARIKAVVLCSRQSVGAIVDIE